MCEFSEDLNPPGTSWVGWGRWDQLRKLLPGWWSKLNVWLSRA